MSFFGLGKREASKDKFPSVETIKSTLGTYRRVITESIDYNVGDYIIGKPEANILKMSEHQPELCHVLAIETKDDKIVNVHVAHWKEGHLCISTITHYLYKKASEGQEVPVELDQFAKDPPVERTVEPGTFVRGRQNHVLYKHDRHMKLSSISTTYKKIYTPCLVMYNEDGKITLAGCAEDEVTPVEKRVSWYELAPCDE